MAKTEKSGAAATTAAPTAVETLTSVAANNSLLLYRKNKRAKEGKANGSDGKYTRTHAVCSVLKDNPTIGRDDCLRKADRLFTERTGIESNMPETYRRYRSAVHVLKIFGVIA